MTYCYYVTALGSTQGKFAYTATLPEAIIPTNSSAGVYYNGVGRSVEPAEGVPALFERALHRLSFILVYLAAERYGSYLHGFTSRC